MTLTPVCAAADFPAREFKGCLLWLKADEGVVTDRNGRVTKWLDQSGQGHPFDDVSGEGAVVAKGVNGKAVVRFNGRGSLSSSHDFGSGMSSHSLLLLARWTNEDPAACQRVISSPTRNWAFGYVDDDRGWIGDNWIYQKDWNLYGPGSLNTAWHLHTGTFADAAKPLVNFWKDDLLLMERPLRIDPAKSRPGQLALGGKARCEIAEVLVYNRVLSQAELTRLWKYLSAKYGITTPAVLVPGSPPADLKEASYPIAPGPFKPDWRSFQQYECPEWFRDAKFGIWAHWSPQCQPEQGDWYASLMYQPGQRQYDYHVAHYGHPSKFGYKDVCNAWKADQWDPEKMIQLYKRAGAKYFVALANHHCNFDCWNSKHQPWNSVNVGPKKDIVGIWAQTARRHGLRFGVTVHCARAWDFLEPAHGCDKTGPLKGVPYDGALTKADGPGQWWEGLDPADLYGPHGAARTPAARQAYADKFFHRVKDLVDSYRPDLLYFDDTVPPLGEAGMNVVAHFLNANREWHHGKLEAVYNTKIYDADPPKEVYKYLVDDFEGGHAESIQAYPWQTDTCIGNWHYYRGINYRTAESVIRELVDIVSKNGNLLLNIPVRGNGSLDGDELKFIEGFTAWMDVNSESIYGTRPWRVYGEGGTDKAGRFVNHGGDRPYAGSDIRFAAKGDVLYATFLAWPGSRATVRSLAASATSATVTAASLLGHAGKLKWEQTKNGLEVAMPAEKPCEHAFVLKISGKDLMVSTGNMERQ